MIEYTIPGLGMTDFSVKYPTNRVAYKRDTVTGEIKPINGLIKSRHKASVYSDGRFIYILGGVGSEFHKSYNFNDNNKYFSSLLNNMITSRCSFVKYDTLTDELFCLAPPTESEVASLNSNLWVRHNSGIVEDSQGNIVISMLHRRPGVDEINLNQIQEDFLYQVDKIKFNGKDEPAYAVINSSGKTTIFNQFESETISVSVEDIDLLFNGASAWGSVDVGNRIFILNSFCDRVKGEWLENTQVSNSTPYDILIFDKVNNKWSGINCPVQLTRNMKIIRYENYIYFLDNEAGLYKSLFMGLTNPEVLHELLSPIVRLNIDTLGWNGAYFPDFALPYHPDFVIDSNKITINNGFYDEEKYNWEPYNQEEASLFIKSTFDFDTMTWEQKIQDRTVRPVLSIDGFSYNTYANLWHLKNVNINFKLQDGDSIEKVYFSWEGFNGMVELDVNSFDGVINFPIISNQQFGINLNKSQPLIKQVFCMVYTRNNGISLQSNKKNFGMYDIINVGNPDPLFIKDVHVNGREVTFKVSEYSHPFNVAHSRTICDLINIETNVSIPRIGFEKDVISFSFKDVPDDATYVLQGYFEAADNGIGVSGNSHIINIGVYTLAPEAIDILQTTENVNSQVFHPEPLDYSEPLNGNDVFVRLIYYEQEPSSFDYFKPEFQTFVTPWQNTITSPNIEIDFSVPILSCRYGCTHTDTELVGTLCQICNTQVIYRLIKSNKFYSMQYKVLEGISSLKRPQHIPYNYSLITDFENEIGFNECLAVAVFKHIEETYRGFRPDDHIRYKKGENEIESASWFQTYELTNYRTGYHPSLTDEQRRVILEEETVLWRGSFSRGKGFLIDSIFMGYKTNTNTWPVIWYDTEEDLAVLLPIVQMSKVNFNLKKKPFLQLDKDQNTVSFGIRKPKMELYFESLEWYNRDNRIDMTALQNLLDSFLTGTFNLTIMYLQPTTHKGRILFEQAIEPTYGTDDNWFFDSVPIAIDFDQLEINSPSIITFVTLTNSDGKKLRTTCYETRIPLIVK